jgi:hypothetical protein
MLREAGPHASSCSRLTQVSVVRIKIVRALERGAMSADHSEYPDENPAPGAWNSASILSTLRSRAEILKLSLLSCGTYLILRCSIYRNLPIVIGWSTEKS